MALNNSDIEQIYKLVSGELEPSEKELVRSRIASEPEMKAEYELQKSLFSAFEKKGEDDLGTYLRTHHSTFVRYGWYLKNKLWLFLAFGIVAAGIIALASYRILNPAHVQIEPQDDCCALPYEDTVNIPEIPDTTAANVISNEDTAELTSVEKIWEEVVKTQSKPGKEGYFSDKHLDRKIPMVEIKEIVNPDFRMKDGTLHISGLSKKQMAMVGCIKWANRWYVRYESTYYHVTEEDFTEVKDVRMRAYLNTVKSTNEEISVHFRHHKTVLKDEVRVRYEAEDPDQGWLQMKYNTSTNYLTVRHQLTDSTGFSGGKEAIRYNGSMYIVTGANTYYRCEADGTCQQIAQLPMLQPYTEVKLPVYQVDREKLEEMNSVN